MPATTSPVPVLPILSEREHKVGCPATRVESYPDRVPPTDKTPARDVVVTRCLDCGGHAVANR